MSEQLNQGIPYGEDALQRDIAEALAREEPCDFVTILWSLGPPVTKRFFEDDGGNIRKESYQNAKWFRITREPLNSFADLARVLARIAQDPHCHIVNGQLIDGVDPDCARRTHVRRKDNQPSLELAPHYWLPMDIDEIEARDAEGEFDPVANPERAVRHVRSLLPVDFQDVECLWSLTSSAGFTEAGKDDHGKFYTVGSRPTISMRLYWWLARPMDCSEAKRWLRDYVKEGATKKNKTHTDRRILDGAIYTPSQPIYTAAPMLEGVDDPVPLRFGICRGARQAVSPNVRADDVVKADRPQRECETALPSCGGRTAHNVGTPTGEPVSVEIVKAMLKHLDPGGPRNPWRDVIAMIRAAPIPGDENAEERRQLAQEWSAGEYWPGGCPLEYTCTEDVDQIFDTMLPDLGDPTKLHFGSLVTLARAAGHTGPISIAAAKAIKDFMAEVIAASGGAISALPPVTDYDFSEEFVEDMKRHAAEEERFNEMLAQKWGLI
jgi:hypothetical protein